MRFFEAIAREPFRLFFPLGILVGIIGVSHWLLYAKGMIEHYSGFFHSTVQMLLYMPCFILGFLLTAMPRFSGSPQASKGEVGYFFFLIIGILIFLRLESWVIAELCYIGILLGLVRFAMRRVPRRREKSASSSSAPPRELIWIPIGVFHGIVGTTLLILGQLRILPGWSILVGKPMMEQGFILSVVLGVGGFLAPRLMGTYQRREEPESLCHPALHNLNTPKARIYLYLLMGVLLFSSYWIQVLLSERGGYFIRASIITLILVLTQSLCFRPKVKDLYVQLIWVSVWMVVIGFWGVVLWPDYRIAMLHIAFIGGFSLMVFAVATMVVMSHAGEGETLRRPLWIFWVVALGIALAIFKRAAVIVTPDAYFKLMGMSATFWLLTAVSWVVFILPRIFKVPADDEFGKMHEKAKERINPTGGSK